MNRLDSNCLVVNTQSGLEIPCSAELVNFEFLQPEGLSIDPEVIRNAATAVLHYFKREMGKTTVSVGEFSLALERVLHGLGFNVKTEKKGNYPSRVAESDLQKLACESGDGFELFFFPRLRAEMRLKLDGSPQVIRFLGLRSCVKRLIGARRWTPRCQQLNDHIVDYMRLCLSSDLRSSDCALVVE